MKFSRLSHQGLSLIEIVVWIGIFSILGTLVTSLFLTSFRSHRVVWDQLNAQNDGRRTVAQFITDVRKAEESSLGAYPIALASSTELIFYANVDSDSLRERVHYWLDNNIIYRGIIHPSGNPLSYEQQEQTEIIARDIVNTPQEPLFSYYNESFAGTSTPMQAPFAVSDIRIIKIQLEMERDPDQSPVPFHIEGLAHIRNVKEN